jgi:hypothetical protein
MRCNCGKEIDEEFILGEEVVCETCYNEWVTHRNIWYKGSYQNIDMLHMREEEDRVGSEEYKKKIDEEYRLMGISAEEDERSNEEFWAGEI